MELFGGSVVNTGNFLYLCTINGALVTKAPFILCIKTTEFLSNKHNETLKQHIEFHPPTLVQSRAYHNGMLYAMAVRAC